MGKIIKKEYSAPEATVERNDRSDIVLISIVDNRENPNPPELPTKPWEW